MDDTPVPVSHGTRLHRHPESRRRRKARRDVTWSMELGGWETAVQPHRGAIAWLTPVDLRAGWSRVAGVALGTAACVGAVAAGDVAGTHLDQLSRLAALGAGLTAAPILTGIVASWAAGMHEVSRTLIPRDQGRSLRTHHEARRRRSTLGALLGAVPTAAGVAAFMPGTVPGDASQAALVGVPLALGLVGAVGIAVRDTSRGHEEWLRYLEMAVGVAEADDPNRRAREIWHAEVGSATRGPLRSSKFTGDMRPVEGGFGWTADIRVTDPEATVRDLNTQKPKARVASAFGTSSDRVFFSPHPSAGDTHARVTVLLREPLEKPVLWTGPTLRRDGTFDMARRVDGGMSRWCLHDGPRGLMQGAVMGKTRAGKSSPMAVLLAEAGLSGYCWTILADVKGGLSVPQFNDPSRVDTLARTEDEIYEAVRAWHRTGMERIQQQRGNRAPSRSFPAVYLVVPDCMSVFKEGRYADKLMPLYVEGIRLFGAVNVGVVTDLQTGKADAFGGTEGRGQVGQAVSMLFKTAPERRTVQDFHGGNDPVVPPTLKGSGWVSCDVVEDQPHMRARVLWIPEETMRDVYDPLRAETARTNPGRHLTGLPTSNLEDS